MATFTVQTTELTSNAAKMNAFAEEFDSIRTSLQSAATSMGAAYLSDDNRTFVDKITQMCQDLMKLSNHLRTASQTLSAQASSYDAREAGNRENASHLPG